MKKYHLELRRRCILGSTSVANITISARDNVRALLDGQEAFEGKFHKHGYKVIDCGMFVGSDVAERDITIINAAGEEISLGLHIIKVEV